MKQPFQILPSAIISSKTNLFAEVSSASASFFFQNDDNKMITGLIAFNFDNSDVKLTIADKLAGIADKKEVLKSQFNNIHFSYAFNESILLPVRYYNEGENEENLNLMYGDVHQGIVLTDHITEKEMYNLYRVPGDIHKQISSRFTNAKFTHQYSLLIRQLRDEPDLLKVIFYQGRITVILQKEGNLQIIRSFKYVTVEDVVYHMLNVSTQFSAKGVNVQLGGMIEKDSALYAEIEKYFLNISFTQLPGELTYANEITDLPAHFFGHLFAFALCV